MTTEKYQEVMDAMALARGTIKDTCDTIRQGLEAGDDPVVFLANMATSFSGTIVFKEGGSGAGLYVMAAFLLVEMTEEMESWKATCEVLEDPQAMADLAQSKLEGDDDYITAEEIAPILKLRIIDAGLADCLDLDCMYIGCRGDHDPLRCPTNGIVRGVIETVNGRFTCCDGEWPQHAEPLLVEPDRHIEGGA